jgi:transglutaminase-like putative cysteine protease
LVLVASSLTFQVWLALYLILFLWLLIQALLKLQFPIVSESRNTYKIGRYSFRVTIFLGVTGYILFLIFPRLSTAQFPGSISISGFSDEVEFGEMTNLLQSEQVVMRVYADRPLKLAGMYLDHFDGKRWQNSQDYGLVMRNNQNPLRLPAARFVSQGQTFPVTVELMPTRHPQLFLPTYTAQIRTTERLYRDFHGAIRRAASIYTSPLNYELLVVERPRQVSQNSQEKTAGYQSLYLALPEVIHPEIVALSQEITRLATGSLQKAALLENFFLTQFQYSLSSQHPGDPMESFILNRREGHCEYFASAMSLMLRVLGFPARMVTGFNVSEYNPLGEYYTVRAKNAHAWVEVYAGDGNWVEFDPTAQQEPGWMQGLTNLEFLRDIGHLFEFLDMKWQNYVLYFNRLDQMLIWFRIRSWIQENLILSLILGVFLILIARLGLNVYFYGFRHRLTTNQALLRLDKILQGHGINRRPGIQPAEIPLGNEFKAIQHDLLRFQSLLYQEEFSKQAQSRAELDALIATIEVKLQEIKKRGTICR